MKAVIVDDELLAVQYLTKVLADIGKTELISCYTSSLVARDEIVSLQPDIVFLDIEMPKMNGLELASFLRTELPHVKIIFITSYEEYALEAIEIGNIDYILKPFEPAILEEKLNKLSDTIKEVSEPVISMICLFGKLNFVYYKDNNELIEISAGKWRTKIARELFTYMLNSRGKFIRKDLLVDMFWPRLSIKEGYNNLYATIHHIRNYLKAVHFPIIIENEDDSYRLHLNGVRIDVDYWLANIDGNLDPTDPRFQSIVKLYRNHYLEEEDYLWAEYNKQTYRLKWLAFMREMIADLIERKEYTLAMLNALQYQHIEPYMEDGYFTLMKLYAKTRDYKSVSKQYEWLIDMTKEEYNSLPEPEITKWYEEWKKSSK
ncbi:MAG TPA: response regulator [Pseudogracilibacillus sp.]|nr:response regulator [Pseudogracilibacillus sp.]